MATTLKMPDVLGLDAGPPVLAPMGRIGGRVRAAMGSGEAAVADLAANDIIVLARIPTNARLMSILLGADNLGAALTVDVGVYDPDGTVQDVDEFASAFTLDAAVFGAATNLLYEAAIAQIDGHGERIWERLGLASDPGGDFDIALTVVTSTTPVAGSIAWQIMYTLD